MTTLVQVDEPLFGEGRVRGLDGMAGRVVSVGHRFLDETRRAEKGGPTWGTQGRRARVTEMSTDR